MLAMILKALLPAFSKAAEFIKILLEVHKVQNSAKFSTINTELTP